MILGFSALFFGGVHVWVYTSVQLSLVCLTLLFVLVRVPAWWRSETGEISWIVTPVNLAAILFLAIVFLQIVSLPEGIVRPVSPNTADILEISAGIESEPISAYHFSLYRHATVNSLMMAFGVVYFYFLLLSSVKRRSQLKSMVRAILYVGIALCLYGLFEKLSGHNHILWWRHLYKVHGFRVFGTFINPNHFAFFLNMMLMLFFGQLYYLMRSKRRHKVSRSKPLFRSFLDNEADIQRLVFLAFCFGVMLLTLIMTGSRAAIFSLALSMSVMLILLYVKTRKKGLFLIIGSLFVIVLICGQRMDVERVIGRFGDLSEENILEQGRMVHNRAVLPIIKEYLLLGTGLGTFEYVYPRYQPAYPPGYRRELHNDWLQLMVETGIVGFLIVFIGFILLMKSFVALWWKRKDPFAVGLGIGCIGAILTSAIHSLFDFSLHIPANAITLAAVVAIGFLALHSKKQGFKEPFLCPVKTIRLWGSRPQQTHEGEPSET